MFHQGATASSSAPLEAAVATAAKILLDLSRASDLFQQPPTKTPLVEGLTWPSALKGKRSRRDASVKERRILRLSPSSPFDLSGASTSGSTSPDDLGVYNPSPATGRISTLTSASSSKKYGPQYLTTVSGSGGHELPYSRRFQFQMEYNGRPPLSLRVQAPRSNGSQRPRKKMRLPEMQEEVRSLEQENNFLQKEAEQLQTACFVLSKENRSLEAKLDTTEAGPSNDKNIDQASQNQGAAEGFDLPDLNFPPPIDL